MHTERMTTTTAPALTASYARRGTARIHVVGCTCRLGAVTGTPGPHAIRTGVFAKCVPAQVESDARTAAFAGWMD